MIIQSAWESYHRELRLEHGIDQRQIDLLRQAFFAGGATVVSLFGSSMISEADARSMLERFTDELHQFTINGQQPGLQ